MKAVKGVKPRGYRLGRRQMSADRTRARVLAAARRLLMGRKAPGEFSLETVAERAGVTRVTLYHQFGSKAGLLEALYDDLGRRGGIAEGLTAAFQRTDPHGCLDATVDAFLRFWDSDRLTFRRLRSMAVLDPDFKGVKARDERRRTVIRTVFERLSVERGRPYADAETKIAALTMLTSFEAFDGMAGATPDVPALAVQIKGLARVVLEAG